VRRSRQWLLSMVALLLLTASVVSCSGNRTTACTTDALTARSLGDLHSFTTWVQQNGVQGAIGEVGWPGGPDAAKWNTLARKWYAAGDDAQIGVFAWSAAERWAPDYPLAIYRDNGLAASGAAPYVVGSQAQVVESDLTVDGGLRGVSLADGTFGASLDNGTKYSTSNRGTYGTDVVAVSAIPGKPGDPAGATGVHLGTAAARAERAAGPNRVRPGLRTFGGRVVPAVRRGRG